MKKGLLTISAIVALAFGSNAQTLINGDCESTMTQYSSYPGNYHFSDNSWQGLEMRPETAAHGGAQAIKAVTAVDAAINTVTGWGSDTIPGFFTYDYFGSMPNVANSELSLWYKATLVGGDSALIDVSVYDTMLYTAPGTQSDDILLYRGYILILNNVANWTAGTISLTPEQGVTGTPNKYEILATSSMSGLFNSVPCHPGSTIWIDDVTLGFAGINEKTALTANVFPNPATDVLNVNLKENMTSVSILSMDGKVVSSQVVNGTSTTVNVSDLNSGMYMYQITTTNGEVVTNSFVKK